MLRGLRIGEFDTKLVIQSATNSNNAITNEPEETWSDLKTIWGKQLGPKSREGYEAQQPVATSEARWMIRRDDAITERMRVNRGGTIYYISGIEDFGRQGYMILMAEKRDNA